jgi:hypothetical protein
MRRFYLEWEPSFTGADAYTTLRGFASGLAGRALTVERVLFGPAFAMLVLLFARQLLAKESAWILLACLGVFGIALILQRYYQDHYLAPVLAAAIVLKTLCLRQLYSVRWRSRRVGTLIAPAIMVAALLATLPDIGLTRLLGRDVEPPPPFRAAVTQKLRGIHGRHLVLVRYSPQHNVHYEWVYNGADIDSSDIVWARDVSAEQNRLLQDYYRDRRVWLLEPDSEDPILTSIR